MQVSWPTLLAEISACQRCRLCQTRKNVVPGEGDPHSTLMFVGEGPGAEEDKWGRPFVGAAGVLLTRMIEAIGLTREQVYIANVVKCRPPQNRVPEADETAACLPYLRAQVGLIRPKIIVLLGATALQQIMGSAHRIPRERVLGIARRGFLLFPT
ncbi:MAG: uracil-DNA glycosylase [Clostridia bacterium]